MRGLCPFDNRSGTQVLFAASSNSATYAAGTVGYIRPAGGWRLDPVGGDVRPQQSQKVYWVDQEGIGAWRLVAIDGPAPSPTPWRAPTRWTRPTGSKASRSAPRRPLRAGDGGPHVFAARRRRRLRSRQPRQQPNLTSYFEQQVHPYQGIAAQYRRLRLRLDGVRPGPRCGSRRRACCRRSPAPARPAGAPAPSTPRRTRHGDDGRSGLAGGGHHNDRTARAAIWYGRDRQILRVDTPNPLVWHGPRSSVTRTTS